MNFMSVTVLMALPHCALMMFQVAVFSAPAPPPARPPSLLPVTAFMHLWNRITMQRSMPTDLARGQLKSYSEKAFCSGARGCGRVGG